MTDDSSADAPEPPPAIREHLYALVEGLVDSDGLLVALDFDGTLAGIEQRPDEATLPESTRDVVAELAEQPDVAVAVVSGRELADVRERAAVSAAAYAGNHGLEIHADEYVVHPTAEAAEAAIEDACELVAAELSDVEGVIVENKGVTATVHYRLVDDEAVPAVVETVESLAAAREDLRLTTGKEILELRPAVEWDKGEAVRRLREELVPDGEAWLPIYVGDDTTDEAAFAVLADDGVAIKVGDDPTTDAAYRVADPEAVRAVLSWLATHGVAFLRRSPSDLPIGTA